MRTRIYAPRAPLSAFVHCFWYSEGEPQNHFQEKLLPNGEASLIFSLRDETIRLYDPADLNRGTIYGPAVLSGARSNCFVIDTQQQERVAGIQFRPGGAFPFFRMPASEAEGLSVDLSDLWRGRSGEIREQLLAAPNIECLFDTLERCLMGQLARPLELHPAVSYALAQFQNSAHAANVTSVRDRTGLSARRFIELFRREVGLTPKVFCRVRRFQQVLETVHRKKRIDWPQVALECGFYDQAHFIHEFQAFSGFTPGEYLAAAPPHLNHVPLI